MSWTCTQGNKESKARKRHSCAVCDAVINPGESQVTRSGIIHGEGFFTMHMHPECEEFSRDWTNDDWECGSPGSITRQEVIDSLKSAKP